MTVNHARPGAAAVTPKASQNHGVSSRNIAGSVTMKPCTKSDGERIACDLDGVLVGLVFFSDRQGLLEHRERFVVFASFVEHPAEVVQERSAPVGGRRLLLAEFDPAGRPGTEVLVVGGRERRHVCGVGGEVVLACSDGSFEGSHEQRVGSGRVAARPQHPSALEQHSDLDDRAPGAEAGRLVEQLPAAGEGTAQPLDARELREHLSPTRVVGLTVKLFAEPALATVEVAKIQQGA